MNLRFEILRAVSKNPGAPMTEICDAIDHDNQKVRWSVIDCKKSGLLDMARDDVTGQPGYHLTEAGKARLTEGAATKQGNNLKNVQPAVTKNTGSSAAGTSRTQPAGAAVQPEPAPEVPADVSTAAPVAVDVKPQIAEIPPQIPPEIPPTEAEDDAMPPADASLLALANRELGGRLARVAHVLRGSGLECLKDLDDGADLQSAAATLNCAYQMALAEPAMLRGELEKADAEMVKAAEILAPCVAGDVDSSDMDLIEISERVAAMVSEHDDEVFEQARSVVELRNLLAEERTARMALQEQLEELQREAMRGATLLSGDDRYTAAGYLVRASKRPMRIFSKAEAAQAAAMAAARNGSGRGEVFALVSVGRAVRGAEWRAA
jgi:hypothetical protein